MRDKVISALRLDGRREDEEAKTKLSICFLVCCCVRCPAYLYASLTTEECREGEVRERGAGMRLSNYCAPVLVPAPVCRRVPCVLAVRVCVCDGMENASFVVPRV
jgi:hypothetical protein